MKIWLIPLIGFLVGVYSMHYIAKENWNIFLRVVFVYAVALFLGASL